MKEEIHKCDKCGREARGHAACRELDLEPIVITIGRPRYGEVSTFPEHRQEWCNACLLEAGLHPNPPKEAQAPEKPKPLEDLIRDMIADEVQEQLNP